MKDRKPRVIAALRSHDELCSLSDLYPEALSNARNDISSLIREHWHIDKTWESHGRGAHRHYRLVHDSRSDCAGCASPTQLAFPPMWAAA